MKVLREKIPSLDENWITLKFLKIQDDKKRQVK